MLDKTFHEIELEAWSHKASIYDELFANVAAQAIVPILNSVGDLNGKRHLDVACGTGHLVGGASRGGAMSEGIDFAPPMIEIARANYPSALFTVADASQLPFEDATFDAVTCSFGLPHMPDPQRAVNEAFRVLKSGGRFSFTLWFDADRGGELQQITKSAIQSHATEKITLPATWMVLRFADEATCEALMQRAGFALPTFQTLPIVARSETAQWSLDITSKMSLRTKAILNAHPESIRARIYAQILHDVETHRRDGMISLAWPALLTSAQKPA